MVFNTVSCFDKTVVVSRIIRCLLNGKILVINQSTIRITFSIFSIFPDYFISRYVTFIMTERYGLRCICCGFISDCRCKIFEYFPIH